MYDFIADLDGFFCETYANYDKLCVLPGYVMPLMQRSEVRADGRTYAYTLPADTMRLAKQEKKDEIIKVAQEIDTYETSILPFEDCCTIFVAKHPVTKPNINVIKGHEKNLDEKIDELVKVALETKEVIHIQ